MSDQPLLPTRWEGPTDVGRGYGRHFADLIAGGADVEGEARLATARVELAAAAEFDVTVLNDDVRRAAEELVSLMRSPVPEAKRD